jgi:NAD(P)-dependent dehydrogenase (short-subunit alcohol dehydrogenase family)
MAVNLRGIFRELQSRTTNHARAGYGKTINISSTTALRGPQTLIHYMTSKGGAQRAKWFVSKVSIPINPRVSS